MEVQELPTSFFHYSNPLVDFYIKSYQQKENEISVTLCGQLDCSGSGIDEHGVKIVQSETNVYNLGFYYNGKPVFKDALYRPPVYKPFKLTFVLPFQKEEKWILVLQNIIGWASNPSRTIEYLKYENNKFFFRSRCSNGTKKDLVIERKGFKKAKNFGIVPIFELPFLKKDARIIPFSSFSDTHLVESDEGEQVIKDTRIHYHKSKFSSEIPEHYTWGVLVNIKDPDNDLFLCLFNWRLVGYKTGSKNIKEDKPRWKNVTLFLNQIDGLRVFDEIEWYDSNQRFSGSNSFPYF